MSKIIGRNGISTLGLGSCIFLLTMTAPALADSGRIVPHPIVTFRGWGMSLAWEANDLYGGGRQPARVEGLAAQNQYMDLLYGNPAQRLTLGFTIVRYNIDGGDDPAHTHMRPDAQMEGFQVRPDAPFDWTRDAPQRRMLHEAQKRGAEVFEAFSNSPPFWMTVSGCASGAAVANQDNLRPEMYESFVDYLVSMVKHFRNFEGVKFESLEAFNEPDSKWTAGGTQEGYAASYAAQNAIIPMLAAKLKENGLDTFVSGVDMNNIDDALMNVSRLDAEALTTLGRLNTHDYHAELRDSTKLIELKLRAEALHKPIWMSELGCCFSSQGDGTEMWGALFMADSVRFDLRDLGAEAWMLWQPDWNVIEFDPYGGRPHPKKQFYALAQYTGFIRPGFWIISAGEARNTLAAYSPTSKRLVLVSTNWDSATTNDLDLGAFSGLPAFALVYRTTADLAVNLQKNRVRVSSSFHILDQLPMRSINTYVVDGVMPSP